MNRVRCKSRALLTPIFLLLVACAATGADREPAGAGGVQDTVSPSVAVAPAPPEPVEPDPADEVAYHVWSAEVLGSEGQLEQAAREYVSAALLSEDPEIAQRATEVAIAAQAWSLAALAADRWVLLDPDSLEARETAARAMLVGGDFVRAELLLAEILELQADAPWGGWPRIGSLLTAGRDVERTARLVDRLVESAEAQDNPYALYTRSQVSGRAGRFDEALELAEAAVARAPAEAQLRSWAGRLALSQRDEATALGHYEAAWRANPTDRTLALLYAELLRQSGEPEASMDVLSSLPDTPENRFTRIAFATESGNRALARDLFDAFETVPYEDTVERAFQAARSAEVLELKEEAIRWYGALEGSRHELIALLRRAYLLAELGRLADARQVLLFARNNGNSTVQMETTLVEAQILAEADQPAAALDVLDGALEQFRDDTRLLYSRALIAVQLDRLDQAEADLRQVLVSEPGNAAALNALGYTLADRTNRLEEAERLIRRAFEIEPEDPAIIDSMGWVAYRLGRLDEAERFLRQALLRDRNAEIAAHLGEVLFVQGREREARQVWAEGQRMDPDDPVLLDTLERFGVDP